MSTATETVSQFDVESKRNSEFSQNVQRLGFLQRWMGFPKKTLKFSKIDDGNKFAVQCGGNSKVFPNVQILRFRSIKEYFGFSRKTEVLQNGKCNKLAVESTEMVTVLKNFKLQAFLNLKKWVFGTKILKL